jgi:hypothetical protein
VGASFGSSASSLPRRASSFYEVNARARIPQISPRRSKQQETGRWGLYLVTEVLCCLQFLCSSQADVGAELGDKKPSDGLEPLTPSPYHWGLVKLLSDHAPVEATIRAGVRRVPEAML